MSADPKIKILQIEIPKPCDQDWDQLVGDDKRKFCSSCGCFVHNVAKLNVSETEEILSRTEPACTRIISHPTKGVLTLSGWMPQLILIGVVAASSTGCLATMGAGQTQDSVVGKLQSPLPTNHVKEHFALTGKLAVSRVPHVKTKVKPKTTVKKPTQDVPKVNKRATDEKS